MARSLLGGRRDGFGQLAQNVLGCRSGSSALAGAMDFATDDAFVQVQKIRTVPRLYARLPE
jgi:hypothetical protein